MPQEKEKKMVWRLGKKQQWVAQKMRTERKKNLWSSCRSAVELNGPVCTKAVVHNMKVFGPVLHAGMMNDQLSTWCKEALESRSQVELQENMPAEMKYSQQVNPGEGEEVWN